VPLLVDQMWIPKAAEGHVMLDLDPDQISEPAPKPESRASHGMQHVSVLTRFDSAMIRQTLRATFFISS